MIIIGENGVDLRLRLCDNQIDVIVVNGTGDRVNNGNVIGIGRIDSNPHNEYGLYLWWGLSSSVDVDRDEHDHVKVIGIDSVE